MKKDNFLKLKPIQKFIKGVGADIKKYIDKDKTCIVALGDDGVFYAKGLYEWLNPKNSAQITFTCMDDEGNSLEEEKIKGRKILIVDNDIITGKSCRKAMDMMRKKKEKLDIKDIKFAVLCDRVGLADFSVEGYSAFAPWGLENLDALDLQIIQVLSKDGRKSFVEIAKNSGLTAVAIKNRVEKMIEEKILKIQGMLNMEKFYSVSANIEIEADDKTIKGLIEKFEKSPLVYHLVKTSGRYNVLVSIVAPNLSGIENFINEEIRSLSGVKHIEVSVGELPIIPKAWNPTIS